MTRTHRTAGFTFAAIALLATACGNSTENGLEQLIEQETGDDVNIDLGGDGINVVTSDGSFTLDEDGNFTAVGQDGQVVTGDIDADDDSINIESDDGNISIEGDGDSSNINISNDDAEISFSSSQEIPEEWPSAIPEPAGLTVLVGTTFNDGTNSGVTVSGTTSASPEEYVAAYGPMLEAAGLERTSFFENGGNVTAFYESTEWVVTVSGAAVAGETNINVGVSPMTP